MEDFVPGGFLVRCGPEYSIDSWIRKKQHGGVQEERCIEIIGILPNIPGS